MQQVRSSIVTGPYVFTWMLRDPSSGRRVPSNQKLTIAEAAAIDRFAVLVPGSGVRRDALTLPVGAIPGSRRSAPAGSGAGASPRA
jgi:hypothetical protein